MRVKTSTITIPVSNMAKAVNLVPIIMSMTFFFLSEKAEAQPATCARVLDEARAVAQEGRVHLLEGLLSDCIRNGFGKQELTEAYRLLTLAYLYLDETRKAGNTMLALLKANHGYRINPATDPEELIHLYRSFRTAPIFFYGLRAGLNTTFVKVDRTYAVHDLNTSAGNYRNAPGFAATLFVEKSLNDRFVLQSDWQYMRQRIDYENSLFKNTTGGGFIVEQRATEEQTLWAFGINGQYRFSPRYRTSEPRPEKTYPYLGAGVTIAYIGTGALRFESGNSTGISPNGPDEDLVATGFRKRTNFSLNVEVGIKKPLRLNYLSLAVRYSYGLTDITDRHYDYGRLSTYYGWAADAIKLRTATLWLGIHLPWYAPKKIRP